MHTSSGGLFAKVEAAGAELVVDPSNGADRRRSTAETIADGTELRPVAVTAVAGADLLPMAGCAAVTGLVFAGERGRSASAVSETPVETAGETPAETAGEAPEEPPAEAAGEAPVGEAPEEPPAGPATLPRLCRGLVGMAQLAARTGIDGAAAVSAACFLPLAAGAGPGPAVAADQAGPGATEAKA